METVIPSIDSRAMKKKHAPKRNASPVSKEFSAPLKQYVTFHPSNIQTCLAYGRYETLESARMLRQFSPTRLQKSQACRGQRRSVGLAASGGAQFGIKSKYSHGACPQERTLQPRREPTASAAGDEGFGGCLVFFFPQ